VNSERERPGKKKKTTESEGRSGDSKSFIHFLSEFVAPQATALILPRTKTSVYSTQHNYKAMAGGVQGAFWKQAGISYLQFLAVSTRAVRVALKVGVL
jgi:hypothetical protein